MGSVERYLVDGMNVIGCRPDGWWRNRDAAVLRLILALAGWRVEANVEVTAVFDGARPSGLEDMAARDLTVVFVGRCGSADDEIVRRIGIDADPASVRMVTSDGFLGARVRAVGAGDVVGAGRFRRLLDPFC